MKLGIFIRYLIIALASYFASCYFVGCNSANHTHISINAKEDSTAVKAKDSANLSKFDSSSFRKKDSANVKKQNDINTKVAKHIDDKTITVIFDTGSKALNSINPYKYNVGGTLITSPQPITSTVINVNNEDDSSSSVVNNKSDSTKVNSSDSTHKSNSDSTHKKGNDSTHLNKKSESVVNTKKTSRFPIELIIVGVIVLLGGGYLLYRKYFPL